MNKIWIALIAGCFLVGASVSSNAQDKAGKKNVATQMVAQFMKQLEKAELSAEQTAKIKELFTKAAEEVGAKRTAGGYLPSFEEESRCFESCERSRQKREGNARGCRRQPWPKCRSTEAF